MKRRRLVAAAGGCLLGGLVAPQAAEAAACSSADAWAGRLRRELDAMAAKLTRTLKPWPVPARVFQPEAYGLDRKLATAAIQAAVDACAEAGGGTVRLSDGEYVSGTIVLRSGVMLEVAAGARLLASTDLKHYPEHIARRPTVQDSNMGMHQSLIFAEGCERIGISGKGVIDGRGSFENFPGTETIHATPGRPFVIRILDSRHVVVRDIAMKDSPCWMQNYLNCEDLLIDGIHVENQANHNNDGIDIDGCRRVIVRNCWISSGDDAMCFKGASQRPTENVLIENSQFYSSCNAIKMGTDSQGDLRNVLVRHVKIGGPSAEMRTVKRRKSDGGVSWESVDGGTVERIVVHDVQIVRAESPLFLRLGDRGRVRPEQARPAPGRLRHIVFDRIRGDDNGMRGSFFTGIPEHCIEHVLLRDIKLTMAPATGPAADPAQIPEDPASYPDPHMFSTVMPAYGLWVRHVRHLNLQRVHFAVAGADSRPMLLTGVDSEAVCGM